MSEHASTPRPDTSSVSTLPTEWVWWGGTLGELLEYATKQYGTIVGIEYTTRADEHPPMTRDGELHWLVGDIDRRCSFLSNLNFRNERVLRYRRVWSADHE